MNKKTELSNLARAYRILIDLAREDEKPTPKCEGQKNKRPRSVTAERGQKCGENG